MQLMYSNCLLLKVVLHLVVLSIVLRAGGVLINSGKPQIHMTRVSAFYWKLPPIFSHSVLLIDSFCLIFILLRLAKAAADQNAAWAAYYAQYYGQQPNSTMAAHNSSAPAAAAPGDQGQAAQTSGGQPDYTKAWEEYYKKMGMSK